MKISARPPVLFAGKTEYQANLATMRTRIKPLEKDLKSWQSITDWGAKAEKAPNRLLEVYYAARGIIRYIFTTGRDADGMELIRLKAKNPAKAAEMEKAMQEKGEQQNALRATVKELREEPATETEKAQWEAEFGQPGQPLTELERFVLKEWN